MNIPTDISRLIAANILNQPLSETEQSQLDAWLKASDANAQLYNKIESLHATQQILKLEEAGYGRDMAKRFKNQIRSSHSSSHRRPFYIWMSSAAAVIVLILSVALYQNYHHETVVKEETTYIQPGKTGAVLTLANGKSVHLGQNDKEVERLIDSVYVADAHQTNNTTAEVAYHTLSIPAGEEFFCQLDDQTSVWLNSETELRFPKKFGKGERKVYLKGEAFFEVSKDQKRPFIVSMDQGDIKVYGTRFNITNYAETPLAAVLVEGSIGFTTPQGQEVKIKPSEKLTYEQDKGTLNVCTVDTFLYTAWVNHLFFFDGQPLEEIMTTLARWYNFTVTFASDDIRHIRLSGQLYRYDDISILLNSYEETTGLKFNIEEKTILITK